MVFKGDGGVVIRRRQLLKGGLLDMDYWTWTVD